MNATITVQPKSTLMNILSIVGFVIIVGIGIWGAVNAVKLAPSLFATLGNPFVRAGTTLTLKLPTSPIEAGTPFSLGWDHTPQGGLYAFSYACRPGFHFETPATGTGGYKSITCETAYSIPVTESSLTLLAVSDSNRFIDIPLAVAYVGTDGKKAAEGSGQVTIENQNVASSPATTGTNTTKTSTNTTAGTATTKPVTATVQNVQHASNPNGIADLAVRVLSVTPSGALPTSVGNYPYEYAPQTTQAVDVRFDVKNVGTKTSSVWNFVATLPTQPPYNYQSPTEQVLGPGDHIEFTLHFDHVTGGSIVITVDPTNAVRESTKANNTVSYPIAIAID